MISYNQNLDYFSFAGGKSLHQLRQLFFRMKDEIFAKGLIPGTGYDTIALEKILQEELGANTRMSDVRYPRYAVY